ncbi:MAG: Asp-tRNA(Asn)/Glu-tRNA(Gln) amidotransferase subunit GatC [Clostridia bacterium]|nr:Asp-tRNA(Asn)/Glu-tRNA(Gln) amidotransferase subunit GatC [Clostridia bacterium]
MKITHEQIEKLAAHSGLELGETELKETAESLTSIVQSMEVLNTMEFSSSASPAGELLLREDTVLPSMNRRALLQNAPKTDGGYVAVPKTVE